MPYCGNGRRLNASLERYIASTTLFMLILLIANSFKSFALVSVYLLSLFHKSARTSVPQSSERGYHREGNRMLILPASTPFASTTGSTSLLNEVYICKSAGQANFSR